MPYNLIADSFHTGGTAEALRANIDRKSTISLQREGVARFVSCNNTQF